MSKRVPPAVKPDADVGASSSLTQQLAADLETQARRMQKEMDERLSVYDQHIAVLADEIALLTEQQRRHSAILDKRSSFWTWWFG